MRLAVEAMSQVEMPAEHIILDPTQDRSGSPMLFDLAGAHAIVFAPVGISG
jgi:hypothetical protein